MDGKNCGRLFFLIFVLFVPVFFSAAQSLEEETDLSELIGWTLDQACAELGAPAEIFPFRGGKDWQDTVVFYFDEHFYLFWYENRVWQVRADHRYKGELNGIAMGVSKEELENLLGEPLFQDDTSVIYNLPDEGHPMRMRLFFEGGALSDLYIYRSDF